MIAFSNEWGERSARSDSSNESPPASEADHSMLGWQSDLANPLRIDTVAIVERAKPDWRVGFIYQIDGRHDCMVDIQPHPRPDQTSDLEPREVQFVLKTQAPRLDSSSDEYEAKMAQAIDELSGLVISRFEAAAREANYTVLH